MSAFGTDIWAGAVVGLTVGGIVALLYAVLVVVPPHVATWAVALIWHLDTFGESTFALRLLVTGLSLWFLAAMSTVLWFGLRRSASWWHFIAVAMLARQGALPRRPLRFLEDAYGRGVLRQAATVYEFATRASRSGSAPRTPAGEQRMIFGANTGRDRRER